jgi:hypothetical protein
MRRTHSISCGLAHGARPFPRHTCTRRPRLRPSGATFESTASMTRCVRRSPTPSSRFPSTAFRMAETVLVHRPSATVVVTDLVHNIGRPTHLWTKAYTSACGFYDRVAQSRVIRWTAYSDRGAARRSVDALLAQPFERLIVGHGEPLAEDAHAALATATAWLPAPSAAHDQRDAPAVRQALRVRNSKVSAVLGDAGRGVDDQRRRWRHRGAPRA